MPHQRQRTGSIGEAAVEAYLVGQGYIVLDKNWHAGRWGEIDIIAQAGDELVFIEVKTRRGVGFGNPEDAVTAHKQDKLKGAAQAYLTSHPHLPQQSRFDVVAVILSADDAVVDIRIFPRLTFA